MRMLTAIAGNGVRTVIVETANRFSRDLIAQETGHRMLRAKGIELLAADSPDSFVSDTPTAVLIRQVLGAVAQFERAALVSKLEGARNRKRKAEGRCGGHVPHFLKNPAVVKLARKLRDNSKGGKPMSLRAISEALAKAGHVNANGRPFHSKSVLSMLRVDDPRRTA